MNEILSYFFHPELSMALLFDDRSKRKWQDGIVKWILVAILSGLIAIVMYKIGGVDLESFQTTYYGSIVQGLLSFNLSEGFIWLALAGISIGEILIGAVIRTGLWIILLYIVSKVARDSININQIVKMSVYAILTWIASQLFLNLTICFAIICPIQTINEMLVGLGTLLSYWNLILFIIGYSILSRSAFLKGSIIVLVIQGIIWGVANAFPFLQIFLG